MPTKAEIKRKGQKAKLRVRTGDRVMIISGKDKGQSGYVAAVSPEERKVIVLQDNPDNPDLPIPLNSAVKHRKARTQGEKSARIRIPVPIDISNVMLLDPKTGEPTRIGRKLEGDKIVRYAKKSGQTLVDLPNIDRDR